MLLLNKFYTTSINLDDIFGLYSFVRKGKSGSVIKNTLDIIATNVVLNSEIARLTLTIPNCGGFSNVSEAFSIELITSLFNATNFVTERQVQYKYQCKKIDFLCTIDGNQVGVSVSRSAQYKELCDEQGKYTFLIAYRQIRKKLDGLLAARAGITPAHLYDKSILHVFAENDFIAQLLVNAFPQAAKDMQVEDEISLLITICGNRKLYDDDLSIFGDIIRPTPTNLKKIGLIYHTGGNSRKVRNSGLTLHPSLSKVF